VIKIIAHSKSSIDGVEVKLMGDSTFYYLDKLLLLQTEMNLNTVELKVVYVCSVLTKEEREIFNRLVERLNFPELKKKEIIIDGMSLSV